MGKHESCRSHAINIKLSTFSLSLSILFGDELIKQSIVLVYSGNCLACFRSLLVSQRDYLFSEALFLFRNESCNVLGAAH